MYNYSELPTATLVDILAQETAKITQMMSDKNFGDAYDEAKEKIKNIQAIIETRKGIDISSTDTTTAEKT